jgi:hypothetical protein
VEEATKLRENATDVNEAMEEIQGYLHILQELAVEPQNSMPDVIVWMISGSKRIAFHRIPAYDLLYSSLHHDACGKLCGKLTSIFLKVNTLFTYLKVLVGMLYLYVLVFVSFLTNFFPVYSILTSFHLFPEMLFFLLYIVLFQIYTIRFHKDYKIF